MYKCKVGGSHITYNVLYGLSRLLYPLIYELVGKSKYFFFWYKCTCRKQGYLEHYVLHMCTSVDTYFWMTSLCMLWYQHMLTCINYKLTQNQTFSKNFSVRIILECKIVCVCYHDYCKFTNYCKVFINVN